MNRKEFFEWLSTCPSEKMFFENDDYGLINITFFPIEIEENEDDS